MRWGRRAGFSSSATMEVEMEDYGKLPCFDLYSKELQISSEFIN
jgi:hypothetical protein